MIQLIIPWFAIFVFGLVVFAVGRVLQVREKKTRAEKKAAAERQIFVEAHTRAPKQQQQELGIMAGATGGSSQGTEKRHLN